MRRSHLAGLAGLATLAALPLLSALALAAPVGCRAAEAKIADPTAKLYVSTEEAELTEIPVYSAQARRADFEAFPAKRQQALAGWGGAFNEKGWEALSVLDPDARAQVLKRIFAPGEGLGLDFCRIPIGSSDYAVSRYSLAETPGDLAMEKFSIERDRKMLLPFVKAAQALQPRMRLWGSAWSPPPWMKDNGAFDSGKMKDDPAIYAAYALYLAKWVEAYRAEGVPVEAVAVQNEPYILTHYPSCKWEPAQYRTFVRDHLGPTLAARKSGATVVLGTFNQPDNEAHAKAVLGDEKARAFVGALGLQWNGLPIARAARKLAPEIKIWHTETDCGNHWWEPGFEPAEPPNDFAYAEDTWRFVREYLAGGAELYSLWNIVLDETGKSIDAERPWPQNSPIVVHRLEKKVTYTPMFRAFEHWSRFAPAGSVVLSGSGTDDALAVARPDGSLAIELVNAKNSDRTLRIKVGEKAWEVKLPARSFATLILPAP